MTTGGLWGPDARAGQDQGWGVPGAPGFGFGPVTAGTRDSPASESLQGRPREEQLRLLTSPGGICA